jgi:hypothetical protein
MVESKYDACTLSLSTDGSTWTRIEKIDGQKPWHTRQIDLSPYLGDAPSFRLRFGLKSDSTVNEDGCKVDDVRLFECRTCGPAQASK